MNIVYENDYGRVQITYGEHSYEVPPFPNEYWPDSMPPIVRRLVTRHLAKVWTEAAAAERFDDHYEG